MIWPFDGGNSGRDVMVVMTQVLVTSMPIVMQPDGTMSQAPWQANNFVGQDRSWSGLSALRATCLVLAAKIRAAPLMQNLQLKKTGSAIIWCAYLHDGYDHNAEVAHEACFVCRL